MANKCNSFSLFHIIAIFLIITIQSNRIQGQFFPKIERFISKPDSDYDDFDDDHLLGGPRFPIMGPPRPGLGPLPMVGNPLLGGIGMGMGMGRPPLGLNPLARFYQNPYQQFNPYFGGYPGYQQPRQEEIFTAIGYDKMDPNSQMRLTITERRAQGPGMNFDPMMGGPLYPGMDFDDDLTRDWNAPTNWYVQGAFLGSQVKNKAGQYYLVLTESGRTTDGCVSEALGPIVTPLMVDRNNPFLQHTTPSGVAANQVLIGTGGPTVYASTLEGVSRRQLVGAGLAACQYINNGVCGGYIPFCATVSKDVLPAMSVPLPATNSAPTTIPFDLTGFTQGGNQQRPGSGFLAFSEDERNSFNNPIPLARQNQQTSNSNDVLGLLF